MRILISSITLDRSGVPTYTLTLYNELVYRGYDVNVFSPGLGALAGQMKAVDSLDNIETPDIILAQHKTCAIELKKKFPDTPMIFITHGVEPAEEQPPNIDIDYYISVNEQNVDNLLTYNINSKKIEIVRDFINTEQFKSVNPLRDKPRVLFISNYKKWKAYEDFKKACEMLGLEYKAVGAPYGRSRNMAETINEFDLVITWGRGILEAMACGRSAISYNSGIDKDYLIKKNLYGKKKPKWLPSKRMGAGYITPEIYMKSREYNFGGINSKRFFTFENLVEEIKKYNPKDGAINRELVMQYHDSKKCVDIIINIIKKI